jgi:hypothetical protein
MIARPPKRDGAIDPRRQLRDGAGRLGRPEKTGAEHECIAEPERQSGDEGDLDHIGNAQTPGGVDTKADGAGGEDRRAKIVPDRVADEACQRRDPKRHVAASDRVQREVIVKR